LKHTKKFQIRFNTKSTSDSDRWRLIENGNEFLVSDVFVDGLTYTTKDWLEEIGDFKWHITCEGHCEIKNGIARIKTTKEKSVLKRHILKTITYRIVGTLFTISFAFLIGGSLEIASILGLAELVFKPILYFAHERAWYKLFKIKEK
jgi:uncharacterized membrane protein